MLENLKFSDPLSKGLKKNDPLSLIDRRLAEISLRKYIEQAWSYVEPKQEILWNWHLDAICEHLTAVTLNQISYLLINVPPRHTKSLVVCVFWPTWEWGPYNTPSIRYVCSSYDQGLATRDALRSRRLIQSSWYQTNWSHRFKITSDQNQKTRYDNDKTGYRIATSVRGIGTGEGGDRIIVDDPHNVVRVESSVERAMTHTWWDESMSTRLNNETTGAYIIIMQRSHNQDLTGHIIEKELAGEIDLVHLCLPARYEKEREKHLQTRTPLKFKDPRKEEGEPLDKLRYPDEKLKKLEKRMTLYSRASQLQQRPHPRGGGMFSTENFIIVHQPPQPNEIISKIRYWDKAATEGGGMYTAGVLMCKTNRMFKDKIDYVILDVKYGQWSSHRREATILRTAELDGVDTVIWTEQEPGSGGKESAETTIRNLAGFSVFADKVTGSKTVRAEAYSAQVENKNVAIVNGPWNLIFLQQHEHFPSDIYKDIVDASSGAFNKLASRKVVQII